MAVGVTARALSTILTLIGVLICHLLRPRRTKHGTGLYPRDRHHS